MKVTNLLRTDWQAVEAEETRLLGELTVAQGIEQFLALQREFEPWLQETESFFRQQRNDALFQLQGRLQKLDQRNYRKMEDLITTLITLQKKLEDGGLPSMAIGGVVVGIWGEPRLTRDVDVKVMAQRHNRGHVLEILKEYTPLNADPDAALRRNGVAFFQDSGGTRLDIMLAETEFDETAIGRATLVKIRPHQQIRVCSAEDLIIYKAISVRTKDRADIESVIRRQGNKLDDRYVERWLQEFEQVLDDSTLIQEYRRLRKQFG